MDNALIYIVEDDENIRELVVYALKASGYMARGFGSAPPFYAALADARPALVVLDIMLPGEDGFAILKKLRAGAAATWLPVIMLTAKTSEFDKVAGLDAGVDDYLTKPFGVTELIARVKAVLRRCAPAGAASQTSLRAGPVSLMPEKHTVSVDGAAVTLTAKEFDLLRLLMEHPGRVFDRDVLMDKIWGYSYAGETRTVDAHVRSLRAKLGQNAAALVETVRGVGYRLKDAADTATSAGADACAGEAE